MSGEGVRQRARDEDNWKDMLRKLSAALMAYAVADAGSEAERIADAESDRLEAEILQCMAESSLARKQEREECAKAACSSCSDEAHWIHAEKDEFGDWIHRGKQVNSVEIKCDAAAIHEREREEQG